MSTKKGKYGNPAKRKLLVGDLQKLVQPTGIANPRSFGGSAHHFGGSREHGNSILDATDAVLLEEIDVCTIDRVKSGQSQGQAIFMTLKGRINNTKDNVDVGFIFGADGAAAIITELLALTDRFGSELLLDLVKRLVILENEKTADLEFIRAALDLAIEQKEETL